MPAQQGDSIPEQIPAHLENPRGISRNKLKYLAAFAMLLDHIAYLFLPELSPAYMSLRLIGRITAPIMCFFLAEGYLYTRSKRNYLIRLALFALIAQVPYSYAFLREVDLLSCGLNMLFTLLCSFLMLLVHNSVRSVWSKSALLALLLAVTAFSDWGVIAPLWVLFFWIYRNSREEQLTAFSVVSVAFCLLDLTFMIQNGRPWYAELWQMGIFLSVPLLRAYHGVPGKRTAFHKWFFYVFYPLHLFVLGFIRDMW